MKIGIDIDEVLCEFVRGYLSFLKERGYDVEFDDIFSYNFEDVLGIPRQRVVELINEFNCTVEFDNIDLVSGAKEGVGILKKKFDTHFITARPLHLRGKTEIFLKERFGMGSDKLFFSSDAHGGDMKTKDEHCKNLGIDLMIEDNGEYSMNYARNGIKVVLFDKPWNQGVCHENIIRVDDWGECVKVVEEMGVGK